MNAIEEHIPQNMRNMAEVDILGYWVSYTIQGTGIRVQKDNLQTILDKHGMGDMMPADVTMRTAMQRALTAWARAQAQQGATKLGKNYASQNEDEDGDGESDSLIVQVINPTKDNDFWVFYLINRKINWSLYGMDFMTKFRVKLYRSGVVVVTDTASGAIDSMALHSIERSIDPFWQEYRSMYLGVDIGPIIKATLMRQWAVLTRREGGLYFVPVEGEDKLDRLSDFLGDLPNFGNGTPTLVALPVLDVPKVKRALADSVHNGVMAEISALQSELGKMQAQKAGSVRRSTVNERFTEYQMLLARARTYSELLGMRTEDIEARITGLKDAARTLLNVETVEDVAETADPNGSDLFDANA